MQISTSQDIKKLGTIMFIGAHPDDETFCAGNLLASAVQNGQKVICVTATCGESSTQIKMDWSKQAMGSTRRQEYAKAMDILGVKEYKLLDFPDDGCQSVEISTGAKEITALVNLYQPDTIITFGQDGLTGNPDHTAISNWTKQAVKNLESSPVIYEIVMESNQYKKYFKTLDDNMNVFYNIDNPLVIEQTDCDICFDASKETTVIKLKALASMPSQYQTMFNTFDGDFLLKTFSRESFKKAT